MSLTELLKNIYSYLDILQLSRSSVVESWIKQDVENALKWADYCEKVYNEALGRPYSDSLDHQIRTLGQFPWSLGNTDINLEYLKHARHEIRMSLLQNAHFPSDLFHYLLEMCCKQEGMAVIVKDLVTATSSHLTVQQLMSFARQMLSKDDGACVDTPIRKRVQKCEAELLYGHFKHVMSACDNQERVLEYVKDTLEVVNEEKNGLIVILMSLTVNTDEADATVHMILNWLRNVLETSMEARQIMLNSCSATFLCQVSATHQEFVHLHLKCLMEWGERMEIVYTPGRRSGYTWSSQSSCDGTYDEMVNHVRLLMKTSKRLKLTMLEKIDTAAKASKREVSVWKNVLREMR